MPLLTVEQTTAGYGEMNILNEVSVFLEEGEIVSLIGPNGAGKSTLMKTIFGLLKPRQGKITFNGRDCTSWDPDQIVKLGMCYVPQTENVFQSLTVKENMEMGAFIRKDDFSGRIAEIFNLFPDLRTFKDKKAGDLSGGQRQMVAMGRALMLDPRLLLLDEPSAGLSPKLVQMIFEKIREINAIGVSILMVEQNAKQALALSNRGYVLATGRNQIEGAGKDLLNDPEVARLYLGG
ncbi:ABC transporter ATP-binding protein [Candidatus Acetothermia bacterium]|nr:ABC transporter ATP-binding protein [Candidatus Acetothermia bacterium]MBI3644116.1 ABC transporter ATP-binding protein [Candidatus Acetothermia bacterium]